MNFKNSKQTIEANLQPHLKIQCRCNTNHVHVNGIELSVSNCEIAVRNISLIVKIKNRESYFPGEKAVGYFSGHTQI